MTRETWGSRLGFLLTTMAFSIGIGNFWRFPYVAGANGGGAFVLVYLVFVVILGIPLFMLELGIGRQTKRNPVGAFRILASGSLWRFIGYLPIVAITLICAYAGFVVGRCIAYAFCSLLGGLSGLNHDAAPTRLEAPMADPKLMLLWGAVTIALVGVIVSAGLRKGVEKAGRILMPPLLVLLVILIVRAVTLPGALKGLEYYLVPNFAALGWEGVLAALGQVFFSIGICMAAGMVYGSYMTMEMNVPRSAAQVALGDTAVAFMAGFIILPAVFSFGLAPDYGPNLIFITLPNVFNHMTGGRLFGALFYSCLFTAGLTSMIGGVEALTAWLCDEFGMKRKRATLLVVGVLYVLGIPTSVALGPLTNLGVSCNDLLAIYDFVASNLMLPLGAILMALFAVWVWDFDSMKRSINNGATGIFRVQDWWKPLMGILIPALVFVILLRGLV